MDDIPDLGSYAKPPVVEVVAAARFDDLPSHVALGLAGFWESNLAAKLPDFAVQPPYQAPVEQFDRRFLIPDFKFDVLSVPPPARMWFSNSSGDELVQLQSNWIACNWRKVGPGAEYGRWPARRGEFQRIYSLLETWLDQRNVRLSPNQCEVTYINHVYPIEGVWESHAEAYRVFESVNPPSVVSGVIPEQGEFRSQYTFRVGEESRGRLHVKIQPGFDQKDGAPIFVMELTGRGAPPSSDLEGVIAFLDAARRAVVTMFGTTTTPQAQADWGKQ